MEVLFDDGDRHVEARDGLISVNDKVKRSTMIMADTVDNRELILNDLNGIEPLDEGLDKWRRRK